MHVSRLLLPILLFPEHIQSYNDCMATVRRLPSVEHNFQLVITKVYEDGDQDLLEDEDESESCTARFIGDVLISTLMDSG